MDYEFRFDLDKIRYTPTETILVKVFIQKKSKGILEGCHLIAKDDKGHYEPTKEYVPSEKMNVNPSDNKFVLVELKPKDKSTLKTLPRSVTFTLYKIKKISETKLHFHFGLFCGEFFDTQPKNFITFGGVGNGKSSFINGLLQILDKENKKENLRKVASSQEHCTTELKMSFLQDRTNKHRTNIAVWDTWGMDSENYTEDLFQKILGGYFGSNTPKDSDSNLLDVSRNEKPNKKNKQNCVIFVVSQDKISMWMNKNFLDRKLERVLEYAKKCNNISHFIVVISKMDLYEPKMKSDPNMINKNTQSLLDFTAKIFDTPKENVFPLVDPSFVLDDKDIKFNTFKLYYNILKGALNNSLSIENQDEWNDEWDDLNKK